MNSIPSQLDVDDSDLNELRFVAEEPTQLDGIFEAFSQAAEMNPDDDDGEEGAGDFFFNPDEIVATANNPTAILNGVHGDEGAEEVDQDARLANMFEQSLREQGYADYINGGANGLPPPAEGQFDDADATEYNPEAEE